MDKADLKIILEAIKQEINKDKQTGEVKITHTSTHPRCKIVKDNNGTPTEVPISNKEHWNDHVAQNRKGNKDRGMSRNNRKWLGATHQNQAATGHK